MIIAALLLPLVIGLAALAVEGGLWYADRHDLRNMADAAVLAAGYAKLDGDSDDDAWTAGEDAAAELGYDAGGMDSMVFQVPPTAGAFEGDAEAVEVVVTRQRPLMLSTMFLSGDSVAISMRAVARLGSTLSEACVLALHINTDGAIDLSGSADITLEGCGLMANSIADDAIQVGGAADLNADYIAAVGGFLKSGSGDLVVDQQVTGTRPISDPFGNMQTDPPAGCDYAGQWRASDGVPAPGSTFCNGMRIQGNLTLAPGTYYVKGGDITINATADLVGHGVTFVLTGDASIDINGGADVDLTAPTTGPYNGMLFVSRSTTSDVVRFNGGSSMNLHGAMYFPNQQVSFNGNNATSGGCLRIVAQVVTFNGDAGMGVNCQAYDLPSFAPNNDLSLVE